MRARAHTHIHPQNHPQNHPQTHKHTYTLAHARTHAHTHTHSHTHKHTHTYTLPCMHLHTHTLNTHAHTLLPPSTLKCNSKLACTPPPRERSKLPRLMRKTALLSPCLLVSAKHLHGAQLTMGCCLCGDGVVVRDQEPQKVSDEKERGMTPS